MPSASQQLDQIVRARLSATLRQRQSTRLDVLRGSASVAEPDRDRAARYAAQRLKTSGAESLQGDLLDFVPAWFLEVGQVRARAVGRVLASGMGRGTGFLISPRLLITNAHVLTHAEDAKYFSVQFNYEWQPGGGQLLRPVTEFALDPEAFWLSSPIDELDFTIVAVGARRRGDAALSSFGYLPLSDRPDKHALGMCVNIVQHPESSPKQIVVRDNRLLARGGAAATGELRTLHYSADTLAGSSGSPVFNDEWDVVALHHWGAPHLDTTTVDGRSITESVNEGIRASVIVEALRTQVIRLPEAAAGLLREALAVGDAPAPLPAAAGGAETLDPRDPTPPGPKLPYPAEPPHPAPAPLSIPVFTTLPAPPEAAAMSNTTEFTQVINVPIEIRVRIPAGSESPAVSLGSGTAPVRGRSPVMTRFDNAAPSSLEGLGAQAEKLTIDLPYDNRTGFDPAFVDGVSIDLADILKPRAAEIAALVDGSSGVDAVLHYEHFSLAMCEARKMAFVTATNIDGSTYINIARDTGLPSKDAGPEGDTWFDDPRIDASTFLRQDFYGAFSKTFDKGHLTRRSDPTWGSVQAAVRANADTFHRTNCTPQHFRFNESVKYWQGVERYVLEQGVLQTKSRISVLQGPVLDESGQDFGGIQVPFLFWKLVVGVGRDGKVAASAMVVSQEALLPEKRVFVQVDDGKTAPKVDTFRVSISYLEHLTGLDFGALKPFDTYVEQPAHAGAEASPFRPVTDWTEVF